MATYPIEIRRCTHVHTNGTQCGSPALKAKEFCFYHEKNQPREVELYFDGERYSDGQIMLPVFEDAHSIQTVIRTVVQLMLSRRIERKDAGLLLYALQIASGNLKTMQAEKAKPTHVVVDPEKAGETPLGMTPWSATGQGHDPEDDEELNEEDAQAGSDLDEDDDYDDSNDCDNADDDSEQDDDSAPNDDSPENGAQNSEAAEREAALKAQLELERAESEKKARDERLWLTDIANQTHAFLETLPKKEYSPLIGFAWGLLGALRDHAQTKSKSVAPLGTSD